MARHKSHVHDSIRRVDMATRRHLIDTISLWVSSTEEGTPSDQIWRAVCGIACRVPHERQPPDPSGVHRRYALVHVALQTGRMNRSIDSRSDLYSWGVVLYDLVTGTLPFVASDPMERALEGRS